MTDGRRYRDQVGRYYCAMCWTARSHAPVPTGVAAPMPTATAPAVASFSCVFCKRVLRESDVFYHNGEIACDTCYRIKSAETHVPLANCARCGAQVAVARMHRLEGRDYCDECGHAAQVEANQRAQARRAALSASRAVYGAGNGQRASSAGWIATLVGILMAVALIIVVVVLIARNVGGTRVPDRIPVRDQWGRTEYVTREQVIERLENDPGFRLQYGGRTLTKEEALEQLRR